VVVEELISESQTGNETDFSTVGAMLGFAVMMILDVSHLDKKASTLVVF